MDLRDKVEFPSELRRHTILTKKLAAVTNCELTEHEVILFNQAVKAVALQLIEEGIENDDLDGLIVFFTLNGDLTLYEETTSGYGLHFGMAVHMMERIRKEKNDVFTHFVFIEEMAHHYWHISDERKVKYKVEEIMQHMYSNFTLDYMRERWSLNGL